MHINSYAFSIFVCVNTHFDIIGFVGASNSQESISPNLMLFTCPHSIKIIQYGLFLWPQF